MYRRLCALLALLSIAGCFLDSGTHSGVKGPTPAPSLSPAAAPTPSPTAAANGISLDAIQRLNAEVGYIARWTGTGIGLAKTSDAAATWRRLRIPASRLTALRFIDERNGWAGGFALRSAAQVGCAEAAPTASTPCRGVVLRTDDGGETWQEGLSIPTDPAGGEPIRELQAVDSQRAWVVVLATPCALPSCAADLRRTTDGGKTWTTSLQGGILSMRFASANRGWAALEEADGSVVVRMTSDGGRTWGHDFRPGAGGFAMLDAATTLRAWLLTRDGGYCSASNCSRYTLYRTDNGGISWSSLGNPKDSVDPKCSGGHLAGPLFASTTRGWLTLNLGAGGANVGPGGLLTTEDGGRNWFCSGIPPSTDLISAADPLHLWVTSVDRSNGTSSLYRSEDGGRTWQPIDLGALD